MQNFQLSAFLNISGIGAASGIVYKDNSFYIISDSSGFLYQYQLDNKKLVKYQLLENASENTIKSQKPDFESITQHGDNLHIFGSGSTSHRNTSIVFNTINQEVEIQDFTSVYQEIKDKAAISNEDLNIEGAFFYLNNLYFFQRGNGEHAKNGIIILSGFDNLYTNHFNIAFHEIKLPKINQVEATFTDAIRVEDKIYFLAAAEDSQSTYKDGEVLGSFLGCLNLQTLALENTIQISKSHKFEGLTLHVITENTIEFFLCEDNDTEQLETTIYKLTMNK